MIVILRAPDIGERKAFAAELVVEDDRVRDAPEGFTCFIGWSANSLRKFCRDVDWTASVKRNPTEETNNAD